MVSQISSRRSPKLKPIRHQHSAVRTRNCAKVQASSSFRQRFSLKWYMPFIRHSCETYWKDKRTTMFRWTARSETWKVWYMLLESALDSLQSNLPDVDQSKYRSEFFLFTMLYHLKNIPLTSHENISEKCCIQDGRCCILPTEDCAFTFPLRIMKKILCY